MRIKIERPHIFSKFYSLTNKEWTRAWDELKPAEIKVLYYLRTLDPFGDRSIEIGVRELASALNSNPGTVSRALKTLSQKGWIDLEIVRVNVKLKTRSASTLPEDSSVASGQQARSTDNSDDLQTTNAIATQQTRSTDNKRAPEALPSEASGSPHTTHTDQTFKTIHTTTVCVENEQKKENQQVDQKAEADQNEHTPLHLLGDFIEIDPEESSAPSLLHKAKQLGVNLDDRKLQKAIYTFRDRLPDAINALIEKASTVRYPTRFLEKAIIEAWKPERPGHNEFSEWYNAARQHNCGVIGSTQVQGVQWVFARNGQRYRWDDLRYLSWQELRQRLNPSTTWTPYADLSTLLAAIDVEIRRLGWIPSQIQAFLTQTFGKASRSQLSDDQLAELLNILQGHAMA